MKKKYLLTLLPILALASCAKAPVESAPLSNLENNPETVANVDEGFIPYVDRENGLPVIHRSNSEHTTYLMLSPFGSIEGYSGNISVDPGTNTHYEHTVVLKADAGDALPTAAQVKSSVTGATFRGWAYYDEDNEHVWPDYYTTVPAKNGLALKAIFDGTITSGGGSGGGGGGGGTPSQDSKYGIIFSNGDAVFAKAMADKDHAGRDQFLLSGQQFNVGDIFSLYDSSTGGKWAINLDEASFGGDLSYLSVDTTAGTYTVNKAFKGNLYIKLSMAVGDQLYIGLL